MIFKGLMVCTVLITVPYTWHAGPEKLDLEMENPRGPGTSVFSGLLLHVPISFFPFSEWRSLGFGKTSGGNNL